jgi:ABC-type transport system involved in multi-copper enzyme maturation permease subunit
VLKQILSFEIRYQLRRPATWLYFAILFLLSFGFLSSDAVEIGGGRGKVLKNAPWVLANTTIILTAVGQVITSALVGTSILRDFQTRTHELLFTTRITRTGYLAGRFGGAFVAMLVVYTAIPLGALVGSAMPWIEHDKMLPIHLANYLQPFLLLGLTNVLFISAAFFAAGALTRNQFVVYTMGIFLLVAWSITGQLTRDLRNDWIGALLDPFGIQPFTLATRYWTVADKNTLLVPLSGFILWNRLAWLAVSGGLVALTLGLFRFRAQPASVGLPWRRPKLALAGVPAGPLGDDRPGVSIGSAAAHAAAERLAAAWRAAQGGASRARQLLAVARMAFASMTRQVSFLAIATVGAVNVIMSAWFANRMDQVTVYPRTYLIADAVVGGFGLFFVILLTTFVGELVWRERQLGADQIQDALPVGPGTHLVGRALGLVGVMAVLQLVLIAAGMVVQTVKGYYNFELSIYFRTVFLIEFPFVLQYALLAFLVHTVVNNKAVGHVVLLAWWVSLITLDTLGFEHLLYQFGSTARYTYSDMNGYGHFMGRTSTFIGYWTAFALALSVIAYLFWVRGTDTSWTVRRAAARVRFRGAARGVLGGATAATMALGGFAFYNTNVLHTYANRKSRDAFQAEYEKHYKVRFERAVLPTLVAVDVEADLWPERRAYTMRGTQTYVNRSGRPLDSLILSYPGDMTLEREAHVDTLAWSRTARAVLTDRAHGFGVWKLDAPLAPGDTIRLRYVRGYDARGFPNGQFQNRIAANGTFLDGEAPVMGYDINQELTGDDARKKVGLKPRPLVAPIDSVAAYQHSAFTREGTWIKFSATVRTAPDQIALAPGYLQSETTENGRRVFRYVMDAPMADFYSFLSARYAVKKATWRGPVCAYAVRDGCTPRDTTVAIEVYYQPGHEYNVDRMITAVQKTLDYATAHFGPYQHRQVRILEFPRYATFAQSFPNTIPFSEGIGFITEAGKDDAGRDLPFTVTAHEVAHQWWGHQVMPAGVQGETMLVESMAEYTALMTTEKQYGRHAMEKYLREELDWYLRGRGTEDKRELPLALVEGQGYIRYGKGGLTLYALRDYIGEEAMNRALSSYVKKVAFQEAPFTTTKDLLAEFRAVTPDSLQYLVKDLFETITLWDLKTENATATKRADGKWVVKLDVAAKKVRADTAGAETAVPMADYVTVGVFGAAASTDDLLGAPLYVAKQKITGDRAHIEVVVDKEPVRAGVDPYHLLIDRNHKDNVKDVERR